jgi:hypothetical protein
LRTATGRHPDYLDTSIFRFVCEESQEFCPALIVNVFRQEAMTQCSHLEIFDRYQTELRDQPFAQVVRVVPTNVANSVVLASHQVSGFPPTPGPLDAPRYPPLRDPKTQGGGPVCAWAPDHLARREGRKVRDTEVDTHGHYGASGKRRGCSESQCKAGVPATDDAADGDRTYRTRGRQFPVPTELDVLDAF